ncbi:MAG TPA: 50S ribosomal protein L29 [Candidatus Angelobacter sp.]|nr:50S ribosomal protein L29 [Candidatus Angelobacter sp.]
MDAEKLRNLTDAELQHQQRDLNDQLFRLKFQLKMGQTESITKIRGLRKDVARIHTVMREKELGIVAPGNGQSTAAAGETSAAEAAPKKKAAAGTKSKTSKKAASKKTTAKTAKKKTTATAKKRKK